MRFLFAVLATLYLWDEGILKGPVAALLFFVGLMFLWAAWWVFATRRIYEQNLNLIPTFSNSIPLNDPIRLEIEDEKRRALRAAVRGVRWINQQ